MQAYHSSEPPYYSQAQYAHPQAVHYTSYAPYPTYLPPAQNIATPFPTYPVPYDHQPQYSTSHPRRRKLSRTTSTAPSDPAVPSRPTTPAGPLKSAMKRKPPLDRSASTGTTFSERTGESRQRVNSTTRARPNTTPQFIPDHLFLSLHSMNELRIDNIAYQATLDDLRESVLHMWPQGVSFEDSRDTDWRVRFAGSPWTSVGTEDAILAQRLIIRLFTVLARQGYEYITTVQTANAPKAPRLVFLNSTPDYDAQVFMTMFSPSKMRLTLIDAPPDIGHQLAASLRTVFPRKISSYGANEDGIHVIEAKKDGFRARDVDKNVFCACMLKFFNSAGYKLDGSVPLGKKGPLGLGSRREAWLFRSKPLPQRPESRQSRQKQ